MVPVDFSVNVDASGIQNFCENGEILWVVPPAEYDGAAVDHVIGELRLRRYSRGFESETFAHLEAMIETDNRDNRLAGSS